MLADWSAEAPAVFKVLGHNVRWQLLRGLAHSDCRVQELVQVLGRPQNLVSYHLRQLREEGLVHERRSSADSRDVYYHLDLGRLQELLHTSSQALHPALSGETARRFNHASASAPVRVLFLCTHNSARSQMAEGIMRQHSRPPLAVFSAGSAPSTVHPLAIQVMAEMGIDISAQQAKHYRQFVSERFDYVITVCDRMREICPVFPDGPQQIHWSIPDPAEVSGSEPNCHKMFQNTASELTSRVNYLLLSIAAATPIPQELSMSQGSPLADENGSWTSTHFRRSLVMSKAKVLFLCTGNSARSQMAEAFLRACGGEYFDAYSAGLEPKGINPYTRRVMAELGYDLTGQSSKSVMEYLGRANFGYLITVCGDAERNCPRTFLGISHRLHWDLEDPAAFVGSDEETLAKFRAVRDEIEKRVRAWVAEQRPASQEM